MSEKEVVSCIFKADFNSSWNSNGRREGDYKS